MNDPGFALLYAMLVSSIVLSIGIGVFNVTLRQSQLESAARESQYAFYAADTGAECVYYWDARWQRTGLLESPFPNTSTFTEPSAGIVKCNGSDLFGIDGIMSIEPGSDATKATSTFTLSLPGGRNAVVTFGKTTVPGKYLEVRGHNVYDIKSPRLVERTIKGPLQEW